MYTKRFFSAFGVAAVISAAQAVAGTCYADNCLRAIRASTRLPLASAADCPAAIDVTVTPNPVTIIEYSTVSETDTVSVPTTLVEIYHDTLTTVVHATSTVDVSVTVTVQPVEKRTASADIPAYASPCSSLARFASACSCIGVTARTFTAATPSTTVTLPVTNTLFTSTTVPVETDSATVEDATVTQTTIITTVTNQVVTTVTATPQQSVSTRMQFSLNGQTYYVALDSLVVGQEPDPDSDRVDTKATTNADDAIQVTLDSTGQLVFRNKVAKRLVPSPLPLTFFFADDTHNLTPYICSKDTNNLLSCSFGDTEVSFGVHSSLINLNIFVGTRENLVSYSYEPVDMMLVEYVVGE